MAGDSNAAGLPASPETQKTPQKEPLGIEPRANGLGWRTTIARQVEWSSKMAGYDLFGGAIVNGQGQKNPPRIPARDSMPGVATAGASPTNNKIEIRNENRASNPKIITCGPRMILKVSILLSTSLTACLIAQANVGLGGTADLVERIAVNCVMGAIFVLFLYLTLPRMLSSSDGHAIRQAEAFTRALDKIATEHQQTIAQLLDLLKDRERDR